MFLALVVLLLFGSSNQDAGVLSKGYEKDKVNPLSDPPIIIADGSFYITSRDGFSAPVAGTDATDAMMNPTGGTLVADSACGGCSADYHPPGLPSWKFFPNGEELEITIKFKPDDFGPPHIVKAETSGGGRNLKITATRSGYKFRLDPADNHRANYVDASGNLVNGHIIFVKMERCFFGCITHSDGISSDNKVRINWR